MERSSTRGRTAHGVAFPICLLFMGLLLAALPAAAGNGQWTGNGPYGGDVIVLAIDPTNPAIIYAGTDHRGVFKSTNGGAIWSQASTGLHPAWDPDCHVDSFAIDPANPDTLYAGTGGGVYKSTNGGANWVWSGSGVIGYRTKSLIIDPANSSVLYSGTWGGGVNKSTNGGGSWSPANTGLPYSNGIYIHALAVDPSDTATIYAGTEGGGVYKSTNGGGSWFAVNTGLANPFVKSLAVDPADPATIYAGTFDYATAPGRVFRSTDGGGSWSPFSDGLPNTTFHSLAIDPFNHATIYAATDGGVFKSTDGGGWNTVNSGLEAYNVYALAMDPSSSGTLYAGTYRDGVYKSMDSAGRWSQASTGLLPCVTVWSLAMDQETPATIYAGVSGGVYKSTNDGGEWTQVSHGLPADARVQVLAADPADPATLYAVVFRDTVLGSRVYKSTNGGGDWGVASTGIPADASISTLVIDPSDHATIYAGTSDGVFKSSNSGSNWNAVNNGLTITSIYTLTMDPTDPATLYAGVRGAQTKGLFKSSNGGDSWSDISTPAFNFNLVLSLAVDPGNPATVYAVTEGGVIYKSTDGGASWGQAATNIGLSVKSLVIDPNNHSTIYAGSWDGVSKSSDGGASWTSISSDQTDFSVYSLVIKPGALITLYAGTGNGVFSLSPQGTIIAAAAPNGSISPSGTVNVEQGSNQTFTITPNAGFTVAALVVDGTVLPAATSYTFTNLAADHYINAYFEPSAISITSGAGANGSISPVGNRAVTPGGDLTYTITPSPGFMVAALVVDGTMLPGAATYTFTNVTSSHYINAYFEPSALTVNAAAGPNGSISPPGATPVTPGASIPYTITPNPGFMVAALVVDGTVLPGATSYTFGNCSDSHYINAYFAPSNITITAAAAANGSISSAGVSTVAQGSDVTYTITPNPGFTVAALVVDGAVLPGATSYTFTNVQVSHYINAYFQ